MHFAFYKLSNSPNPRVQYLYTCYTLLLILIQLYVLFAVVNHILLLSNSQMGFDPLLVFHSFPSWVTSVAMLMRFIEHVQMKNFEDWIGAVSRGETVGRFDGVFAALWAVPYVMVPFAIFGAYTYLGAMYLVPLPLIFGFTLSRWLYRRMGKEYQNGEYAKVSTREDIDESNDGLPLYEERDRQVV
ncbi:hypothetical protein TWF694_002845 [Orbilia ellipsospora]|uniref:Uncharacterized protein n=1 Tax=Orbilia ellipsospora TaxID=2528407 RepID=A0AAV9X0S6_9PEZI